MYTDNISPYLYFYVAHLFTTALRLNTPHARPYEGKESGEIVGKSQAATRAENSSFCENRKLRV